MNVEWKYGNIEKKSEQYQITKDVLTLHRQSGIMGRNPRYGKAVCVAHVRRKMEASKTEEEQVDWPL